MLPRLTRTSMVKLATTFQAQPIAPLPDGLVDVPVFDGMDADGVQMSPELGEVPPDEPENPPDAGFFVPDAPFFYPGEQDV